MPTEALSRLRPYRRALSIAGHLALVSFSYFIAFALRFDFHIPSEQLRNYAATLPYLLALRVLLFHRFGLFRGYWHLVGVRDLRQLIAATAVSSVAFMALLVFAGRFTMPVVVPMLDALVMITVAGGARFLVD